MKSLAEQIADLEDPIPRDFDPESHDTYNQSDSDASPGRNGTLAGREHYENVGKGKLRNLTQPSLGKQYRASAISRDGFDASEDDSNYGRFDDEESDDPFAKKGGESDEDESKDSEEEEEEEEDDDDGSVELDDLNGEIPIGDDEEIDSDEAFDENDFAKYRSFKFRGSKSKASQGVDGVGGLNSDNDNASILEEDTTEDDIESGEDESMSDVSSSQASVSSESEPSTKQGPEPKRLAESSDRSALRSLLSSSSNNLASSLSAAAASDARKGRAVKQQYETFDKLLDLRIKLQKALAATDNLTQEPSPTTQPEIETVKSAEVAALKLFNNLAALRTQFINATTSTQPSQSEDRASKRRKLSIPQPAALSTLSSTLATTVGDLHEHALPYRRAILQKWSLKTRPISTTPTSSRLFQSGTNTTTSSSGSDLLIHLEASVLSATSSLNLPHPSRSSTSPSSLPSLPSYDDTPFYQSLLRDLVAHRSSLSSTIDPSSTLVPVLPTKLHHPGNNKRKKDVDTKASKGRKVRYTVHEKLLNWMASGDERGNWGEDGRREFFAGLMGQTGMLREQEGEAEVDGEDMEVDSNGNGKGGGLRLFR